MSEVALPCTLGVERGPDCIFIRVQNPHFDFADQSQLAEAVWNILQEHFTYRVVLELDELPYLNSHLIGQLVLLHKRIHAHHGMLRLCGLSPANQKALSYTRLEDRLPVYADRDGAVMSFRPNQPR